MKGQGWGAGVVGRQNWPRSGTKEQRWVYKRHGRRRIVRPGGEQKIEFVGCDDGNKLTG